MNKSRERPPSHPTVRYAQILCACRASIFRTEYAQIADTNLQLMT